LGTALWPLFVLPALSAGFSGLDSAGRNAIIPNLVRRSEVSTANAIFQALFQFGLVAGPALAGLLLAGAGVRFVYWPDGAGVGGGLRGGALGFPPPPRVRGGAAGAVPDVAAAARGGRPAAWPALDRGGPALLARPAGHPGRVPDRHQRHGFRHAAGAVPGAGLDAVRRGRVDARVPVRRARRRCADWRAHHRLGFADPAAGPGGYCVGDWAGGLDGVVRPRPP